MSQLTEAMNELATKSAALMKIIKEARVGDNDLNLLKAQAFAHMTDDQAAREIFDKKNAELKELHNKVKALQTLEQTTQEIEQRHKDLQQINETHTHAGSYSNGNGHGTSYLPVPQGYQMLANGQIPNAMLTVGQWVKKHYPPPGERSGKVLLDREFPEWDLKLFLDKDYQLKVMTTTTGWPPYSTPIPRLAEYAMRPLQVIDLFPTATATQFQVSWYEENAITNAAAERAENTTFPEQSLGTTLRTTPIVKIPVFLVVTDEQLQDVDQVQAYIDSRLRFLVQQRFDGQLLNGSGTPPDLRGTLNTSGVQTQARGADTNLDAIYKAMDKVRVTGQAEPNAVLIHPTNFQPIRLLKDTTGQYIWGPPQDGAVMRMWGVPTLLPQAMPLGTAQTGDYVNHTQLWIRQGVEVLVGYTGDDFINGRQVVRCTMRAGLAVYRPAALCNVTGLT